MNARSPMNVVPSFNSKLVLSASVPISDVNNAFRDFVIIACLMKGVIGNDRSAVVECYVGQFGTVSEGAQANSVQT